MTQASAQHKAQCRWVGKVNIRSFYPSAPPPWGRGRSDLSVAKPCGLLSQRGPCRGKGALLLHMSGQGVQTGGRLALRVGHACLCWHQNMETDERVSGSEHLDTPGPRPPAGGWCGCILAFAIGSCIPLATANRPETPLQGARHDSHLV